MADIKAKDMHAVIHELTGMQNQPAREKAGMNP